MTISTSDHNSSGDSKFPDEPSLPQPPFIRQIFTDMWEGMFDLLVWTGAVWVITIPVILVAEISVPLGMLVAAFTSAPGLASLLMLAANLTRGRFARLGDAPRGLVRLYGRSVALALPLVILAAINSITSDMIKMSPAHTEFNVIWALQVGFILAIVILHVYLCPILALYDTPLRQTVALAVVLVGKCFWQTLLLLTVGAALLAATLIHPLVWLFVPGIWCVIITNATFRLVPRVMPSPTGGDK
jgi:hypothetical protein